MASYKEHCAECKQKLGNDWSVVHRWLDAFFAKLGYNEKHREIRHHKKGIEEVRKLWGDDAAQAAEIHIARDFCGYIPEDDRDVQNWHLGVIHTPGLKNEGGLWIPEKDEIRASEEGNQVQAVQAGQESDNSNKLDS